MKWLVVECSFSIVPMEHRVWVVQKVKNLITIVLTAQNIGLKVR
nr:MAG TPA: hypothetical protein [Caudoviricetes sp.]